jgi:DNA-binding Lrp family transcriptional regulator
MREQSAIPEPSVAARLDAIDRQILKELQDDGRITNVELARRVGISAPPCLRRVRALEQAGYIKGYRALLDEKLLGYEVTVFAMVHLSSQAEADLKAFEDFVRAQPLVRECWMLSGEIDFVLKCVAPDLKTFQAFVAELTAAPHVRNVKTSLTLRNSKDAAMVPMDRKTPHEGCARGATEMKRAPRSMLRAHCAASARAGAKAGITSRENSASERNDSASVMSPKASHDTK